MLEGSRDDKDRKIMVIGYGAIGSELVEQLKKQGYKNIAVISSKTHLKFDGATFYDRAAPIDAIGNFQPDLIIDTSTTEFTQQILKGILDNVSIGNLKYVAITPNVSAGKVNTEKTIIAPNRHIFDERKIEVVRTDKTSTLFSNMFEKIANIIRQKNFTKIFISDEHRKEKELFTQGGISTLEREIEWADVQKISARVNDKAQEFKIVKMPSRSSFTEIVAELRENQKKLREVKYKLEKALITIDLKMDRKIEIETLRRIPDCDFESKTGYRSINSASVITSSEEKKTFEAKISKQVIASGVLELCLK